MLVQKQGASQTCLPCWIGNRKRQWRELLSRHKPQYVWQMQRNEMVLNLRKHTQSSSSRELGGWCQHQAVTQPKSVQQLSVRKTTFWGSAISVGGFKQGKTCSVWRRHDLQGLQVIQFIAHCSFLLLSAQDWAKFEGVYLTSVPRWPWCEILLQYSGPYHTFSGF